VRRVLLPAFVALLAAVLAVCTVVLVVALVLAPFTSRRRVLRLAALADSYLVMELLVLVTGTALWFWRTATRRSAGWWEAANFSILGRALAGVLAAAHRTVGFELMVDQKSTLPSPAEPAPLLVLCRHGGLGDSFAVANFLLNRQQRRVRIVLKGTLQWDPALDLLLNRLSACFIPSRSHDGNREADAIGDLARRLRPGDALLLFPEGRNWTPGRQRRAIRHLRSRGKVEAAKVAEHLSHVLPIRPAGVLSCLEARADLAVAVVAHTGLDKLVTIGAVWQALPLRVPMRLRAWSYPSEMVPRDHDATMAWLTMEWAVVDEWIDAGGTTPDRYI
jgi:1-acyl-sn-glycerol-3-phosphate acyltransferase